ncbi:hypothetical protein GCM10027271_47950 [Saccharopolyspora gloriosae]
MNLRLRTITANTAAATVNNRYEVAAGTKALQTVANGRTDSQSFLFRPRPIATRNAGAGATMRIRVRPP